MKWLELAVSLLLEAACTDDVIRRMIDFLSRIM